MNGYPLMLDVSNRLAVIVGGGAVAVRKPRAFWRRERIGSGCVSLEFDVRLPGDPFHTCQRNYDVAIDR
jgi:hypothetical protein